MKLERYCSSGAEVLNLFCSTEPFCSSQWSCTILKKLKNIPIHLSKHQGVCFIYVSKRNRKEENGILSWHLFYFEWVDIIHQQNGSKNKSNPGTSCRRKGISSSGLAGALKRLLPTAGKENKEIRSKRKISMQADFSSMLSIDDSDSR
ncbi:hypothetical protein CEXT_640241 [Caerostris extrusa]|uniref:Uncharacterized protein n=1 Tax=Caerostris extrusa TaxID=172846 RepID=A0AAV4QQX5_CAEEX|nr:hypothetical protein CEXT_640241 [Caerostris extrusa]